MGEVDKNNDNQISFDEFTEVMTQLLRKQHLRNQWAQLLLVKDTAPCSCGQVSCFKFILFKISSHYAYIQPYKLVLEPIIEQKIFDNTNKVNIEKIKITNAYLNDEVFINDDFEAEYSNIETNEILISVGVN